MLSGQHGRLHRRQDLRYRRHRHRRRPGQQASYLLHTDAAGNYALWLPVADNPLSLIAALDGWQPQSTKVKIHDLQTTTANFTLNTAAPCG